MPSTLNTWILADHGKVGTYSQCLGVAQALGLHPTFKSMRPRFPWSLLPPQLWVGALHAQRASHDPLTPPWPDVLIAAGRASIAPAIAIRKLNPKCATIVLQNPCVNPRHFDCVIVPYHDHVKKAASVISVLGALHRLDMDQIKQAAAQYPNPSTKPMTTVLLGGNNRRYRFEESHMQTLAESLKKIGGHCLIAPSRRTSPHLCQALKEALGDSSFELWDGSGENPYAAYLGLADQIIVTQDSISMASEACFMGKPVYIWEHDEKATKYREFHHDLYDQGYAKPFQLPLPKWAPKKLDEMGRVVAFIKDRIPLLA